MKKIVSIGVIASIIILLGCTFGYKFLNHSSKNEDALVKPQPQEEISSFIENLVTNSSNINNNVTGMKFLTKDEYTSKEKEEYKKKFIDIILQQNQEKEWFNLDSQNNTLNNDDIEKITLEELLKNKNNKEDIIEKLQEVINLKYQLSQRYIRTSYLNNIIVQTEETENTISVFIQSNILFDSQIEKKFMKDIATIKNKTIADYFGVKPDYTIDEIFLWNLNKEYEILLFKLSKIPEIKPNLEGLKENLKHLNTQEVNTNANDNKPNNFIQENNKNQVSIQLPADLPVITVPIEYKVNKNTHKIDLNTKVFRTLMLETKTPFEEIHKDKE